MSRQETTHDCPCECDSYELIQELKDDNQNRWHCLVNCLGARLRVDIAISLRKYSLPASHIDEVWQRTWILAYQKIGEFEFQGPGKLYRWLRSISAKIVYDVVRDVSKQNRLHKDFDELVKIEDASEWAVTLSANPEETLLHKEWLDERASAIVRALQELTARDQEIILQCLCHGVSRATLAKKYHLQAESITRIIMRGKELIRGQLMLQGFFVPRPQTQPSRTKKADEDNNEHPIQQNPSQRNFKDQSAQ